MAVSGTITQVKDNFGLLIVQTVGLAGLNNTTPPFMSQGYPFGSFQATLTAGSPTVDTITLQGSNDGVNFANTSQVTQAFTASLTTQLMALAVSGIDAPAKFYQFILGAGGVGTYTITVVLMGTRG